jgi:hypothetical protein
VAGISQATLSRIESGSRPARMDEVIALAWAIGHRVGNILEEFPLRDRVLVTTCGKVADADADFVKRRLTYFLEVDAYLDLHKESAH